MFTPSELLRHTARLKTRDSEKDISLRIKKLLHIVGLSKHKDARCGSLTGGQLKRVSIALGLISQPKVLFLDEPTTGLDSAAAYTIIKYVNSVARELNVVVLCTLHQPSTSVFDLIDDLILLAPGGKLAFFGPLKGAAAFFGRYNAVMPADVNAAGEPVLFLECLIP